MARPTKFTEELANKICKAIATHPVGLVALCKMFDEFPTAETIRVWRWEKPTFSAQYTKAKQFQSEILAESIEDIGKDLYSTRYQDENGNWRIDAGHVAHARLVTDSRKWTACKLAPKIYGDRQHTEVTITHEADLKDLA